MLQALRISFASLSVVVFLLSQSGVAQAPPNADTFATSVNPTQNFGSSGSLPVQPNSVAYLRFTLSTVPTGATVTKATLRVFVDSVVTPGTMDAYQLNVGWVETSLTWNNRPALGTSATGGHPVAISASNLNNFVLMDITSLVQGWVNGTVANRGVGLALIGATGSFSIDSKESSLTSHQPELEIALAGAQGPQGPQGAQGPQGPQGIPGNLNPGSPFYIQNGTATQTSASFNIDSDGTVGGTLTGNTAVNTTGAYQINGTPMLQFVLNDDLFLGRSAGSAITSGGRNVFVGALAGSHNTTGSVNLFAGWNTGANNTTGGENTAVGSRAGFSNGTGAQNTFFGSGAGANNSSGNLNTYLGYGADCVSCGTGSNNIYLGAHSGNSASAESNTLRVGQAGTLTAAYIGGIYGINSPASVPVFVNSNGQLGTTGGGAGFVTSFNGRNGTVVPAANDYSFSQIGGQATFSQISGTLNDLQLGGTYTQDVDFSDRSNSFTGTNLDVSFGTVGALNAGVVNAQVYEANGKVVLRTSSGSNGGDDTDILVGFGAGPSNQGSLNTFVGYGAGGMHTTSSGNTFLGANAGSFDTHGANSTYVGIGTGCQGIQNCLGNGVNNIYIGYFAGTTGDENNTLRIGGVDPLTSAYISGIYGTTSAGGVAVYIDSNGQLGTLTSSLRYKEQVQDMGDLTSRLLKLRPVTFLYKPEYDKGERTLQYGLIAEEVAKVYPELVAYDKDGQPYTVRYQYLASMLLNEVQKQYRRAETQTEIIKAQEQKIDELEQRLSRLEGLMLKTVAVK